MEAPKNEKIPFGSNSNIHFSLFEKQLVPLLVSIQRAIPLGASNKGFTPEQEDALYAKIYECLYNKKPYGLSEKEQTVLKPAIVMSYIIKQKYKHLLQNQASAATSTVTSPHKGPAELELTVTRDAVERLSRAMEDNKLSPKEKSIFQRIFQQDPNHPISP